MPGNFYFSSEITDLRNLIGIPLRTKGCMLLFCISGYAVLELNFVRKAMRQGWMALIFSDTIFSVERVSADFSARKFELSFALTDEVTYLSSGSFFDWLDKNQICVIPLERLKDISIWFKSMEWIEKYADAGYKNVMIRNQWQNFLLVWNRSQNLCLPKMVLNQSVRQENSSTGSASYLERIAGQSTM